MTVLGSWALTLSTPMGPQQMTLHVTDVQGGFRGRVEGPMGGHDVSGTVDGTSLGWTMAVTRPIPVKVSFKVGVDGDTMSGFAKAGIFGKATLSGTRVQVSASAPSSKDQTGPVTAESVDPQFAEPYIEIDEQRGQPEPHRYVHGGFRGTDARFSFYFPLKARYRGRFFHNTYPLATSADVGPFPIAFEVATGNLGFTFDSGAYYVQTNLGGRDRAPPADPAIAGYRVNAAAAKFSRIVAAQHYGEHRAFGYLFGGSGGSYQVMGAAENTRGVWDGFLPFVLATPNAIPGMFTIRMHALRVLRAGNKFPGIVDAIAPGGSGNPFAGLDADERAALEEATRMGFPPRGWWNHDTLDSGYFSKVAGIVPMLDPGYLEDYWSLPGYLGSAADAPIRAERRQFETRVVRVIDGPSPRLELAAMPEWNPADAHLVQIEGANAGSSAPVTDIEGRELGFSISSDPRAVGTFRAGDRVRLDNSWALALQTYHRHQVPEPGLCGWDQFRDENGEPRHPQREFLIGPIGAAGTAGSVPDGRIGGKMLALECLMDIDALAWQADWYRGAVKQSLGEGFEDQFALWFIDHAQHDNPSTPRAQAHTVGFQGALEQGLRDLAAWVETGRRPSDTRYRVVDGQVVLPDGAQVRGGIQPVVTLKANGADRAEARPGEGVNFQAVIEVPPDAGVVVAAEWDFEGRGTFPVSEALATPLSTTLSVSATHAYAAPGTYFAVLRATSQRQGDARTPYGRVQNLSRVRVVVR